MKKVKPNQVAPAAESPLDEKESQEKPNSKKKVRGKQVKAQKVGNTPTPDNIQPPVEGTTKQLNPKSMTKVASFQKPDAFGRVKSQVKKATDLSEEEAANRGESPNPPKAKISKSKQRRPIKKKSTVKIPEGIDDNGDKQQNEAVISPLRRELKPDTVIEVEPGPKRKKIERNKVGGGSHRNKYRPRRNWKKLYVGVRRQIAAKKEAEVKAMTQNSSTTNTTVTKAEPAKCGCWHTFLNFFKADEVDESDEDEMDEATQAKIRRYKEQSRRKLSEDLKVKNSIMSEIDFHLKLKRAKSTTAETSIGLALVNANLNKQSDPLQLENASNATDYKSWVKDVHDALPSKMTILDENPTAELITELVPLLQQGSKTGELTQDASDLIDNFRAQKAEKERKLSIISKISQKSNHSRNKETDVRKIVGNLAQRREAMHELEASEGNHLRRQSTILRRTWDKYTLHLHRIIRDFSYNVEIWHDTIHQIDGQFGVAASTYFRWLRIILSINIIYFIFSFFLIGIPYAIVGNNVQLDESANDLNVTVDSTSSTFFDVFLAEGDFAEIALFYYPHPEISAFPFIGVLLAIFITNSIFIIQRARSLSKHVLTADSRDIRGEKLRIILCAWDFSTSDREAAMSQHRTIARDFRLLVKPDEGELEILVVQNGCLNIIFDKIFGRYAGLALHWFLNISVVFLSLIFAYGAWELQELRSGDTRNSKEIQARTWQDAAAAFVISVSTSAFSVMCVWATNSEKWENIPHKIHVLLARIGFWYFCIIGTIYIFWLQEGDEIVKSHPNRCWESEFGNELYRVILLEFICNTLLSIATDYIWPKLLKILKQDAPKPEFRVEGNMMNLVFVHTLSGIGAIFSPFLSFIVILRLITTFYWKKKVIFDTCGYPAHQFHSTEIFTPYLLSFFVSYLVVTNANAWLVSDGVPSTNCGPFRGKSKFSSVFNVIISEEFVVLRPAFIYCFFFFLCGIIYTCREWGFAYHRTIQTLNELLQLERLDRDFLLKAIFNIAQAHARRRRAAISFEIGLRRGRGYDNLDRADIDAVIQSAALEILRPREKGKGIRRKAKFISQFISQDITNHPSYTGPVKTGKLSRRKPGVTKASLALSTKSGKIGPNPRPVGPMGLRPSPSIMSTTGKPFFGPTESPSIMSTRPIGLRASPSMMSTAGSKSFGLRESPSLMATAGGGAGTIRDGPIGLIPSPSLMAAAKSKKAEEKKVRLPGAKEDLRLIEKGKKAFNGRGRRMSLSAALYYEALGEVIDAAEEEKEAGRDVANATSGVTMKRSKSSAQKRK